MQKLGKSMMLPVSILPVCGILMGLGFLLCPAGMQGGTVQGILPSIGWFLTKAGLSAIDNIAWLFVIGVAMGMANDGHGTACLAGLVSWLEITTLLSPETIRFILPEMSSGNLLAFEKIQNPFIGILAGLIGATCYNHFNSTRLPDVLAFFSGKRFVAIVTVAVSLIVSALLMILWPLAFSGMVMLGKAIVSLGGIGAGIYAFLNRLLIPTGLHHALNNVFWFDTIGIGDLTAFWGGKTSAEVGWSLGMYMSGFFPCMMFGIPGAALAMYRTARDKKRASGILGSTSVCSLICGLTEPFEFSFMFNAFPLYIIYSLLYGIFTVIAYYTGFRAGFSFSGGAIDLLFSASMPAAQKTWLILPLGAAAFLSYYIIFHFAITRFHLATPGCEPEENTPCEIQEGVPAEDRFVRQARIFLNGVGGSRNVIQADCCATRLRLTLNDSARVDSASIKSAGAMGVVIPDSKTCQIIVGVTVQQVLEAFRKVMLQPIDSRPDPDAKKTAPVIYSDIHVKTGDPVFLNAAAKPFTHIISDPVGIHARPAGDLVQLIKELSCQVTVRCGTKCTNGTSIMGWMQLGAVQGSRLHISAEGKDAGEALRRIKRYMTERL